MDPRGRGEWIGVHLGLRHGRSAGTLDDDVNTPEGLADEVVRDGQTAWALLDYAPEALFSHSRGRRCSKLSCQPISRVSTYDVLSHDDDPVPFLT